MAIIKLKGTHNGDCFQHQLTFGEPVKVNPKYANQWGCRDFTTRGGEHRKLESIARYGALLYLDNWEKIGALREVAKVGTRGEGWLEEGVFSSSRWVDAVSSSDFQADTKEMLIRLGPSFGEQLPDDLLGTNYKDPEGEFWGFLSTCKEVVVKL